MNLNEVQLREKMEELEIPKEKIEDILVNFVATSSADNVFSKLFKEQELKKMIAAETDWRRRASLQAQLMILDLE